LIERGAALLVRAGCDDQVEAEQLAEQDRHRADPARPAMDEDHVALGREGALEQVGPDGEEGFGDRRRLDHAERLRDGQALAGRGEAIFGIAPAGDERAHRLAEERRIDALPQRGHGSGYLQTGNRGRAGRGRIEALALHHIRPVHARRGDPDQQLARAGVRHRPLDGHEHLGTAGLGRIDRLHHLSKLNHRQTPIYRELHDRFIDMRAVAVNAAAMDLDELFAKKLDDPLAQLGRQDLDPLSVEELGLRIAALEAEIARAKAKIEAAVNHRASADALFKR
jgi:uncharacterized small protein (DUF1192 family)